MSAVELTVAEAAERLEVTPRRVRALIERGDLPARRVGPIWVVTADAVDAWRRTRRGPGRPPTPVGAWERLRDIARADHPPQPDQVLPYLRERAVTRRFELPEALARLDAPPPGTMWGGAWALGVEAGDRVVDLYATSAGAERLVERLALAADPAGLLALHSIPLDELPALDARERAALAWCDTVERADPAADVASEALWPGSIDIPTLADAMKGVRRGPVPYTRLRALTDWVALHPHLAGQVVSDRPAPTGHPGIDSLAAGVAETIADDHRLPRPAWTSEVPAAPLDVTSTVDRTAARWRDVPAALRERGIGLPGDSLWRP